MKKKIYLVLILVILFSFLFCCNSSEESILQNNIETNTEVIADDDVSDDTYYSEPISDYELSIMRRNALDVALSEIQEVLYGKYKSWVSIDEILIASNGHSGVGILKTEDIEELVSSMIEGNNNVYYGIWSELDRDHYPADGWDRIFAIPKDGKLIMNIKN